MSKINVTVAGAAGYTGAELIRLLVNHPDVNIISAVSRTFHGKKISDLFPDLISQTSLEFTSTPDYSADITFLCMPHGEARNFLKQFPEILKNKVIDLSRDFRLQATAGIDACKFIYGLPELNRDKIRSANHIANPGCFATAIQLGLLPLAKNKLLRSQVCTNAVTGSTGAGIKLSDTTHFSWRQNNASVYSPFVHAHNEEIMESITSLQNGFDQEFIFIPQRGSFTRGILCTTLTQCSTPENELKDLYEDYYRGHPFCHLPGNEIDLKMTVNTNHCFISLKKHKDNLLIVTALDNLLKGAAGQAVQNMNLMCGLDESAGLKLKASTY